METKFNFKSQPCTSLEQSERLSALGLKKETADMCSVIDHVSDGGKWEEVDTIFSFTPDDWNFRESVIPRWSLHRLICMLPEEIVTDGYRYNLCIDNDSICHFEYSACTYEHFVRCENLYDAIVGYIEWLIKEGYFNKEYLVNQAEVDEHCKGVLEYLDYIGEEE